MKRPTPEQLPATWMPQGRDFTEEELHRLETWVGHRIYVDTGDGVNDFELTGTLHGFDGVTLKVGAVPIPLRKAVHIDLVINPEDVDYRCSDDNFFHDLYDRLDGKVGCRHCALVEEGPD